MTDPRRVLVALLGVGCAKHEPDDAGEQRIIDLAHSMALDTCVANGKDLGSCPALAAHKPSWLRLPPTDDAWRDAGIEPPAHYPPP